MDDFTVEDLIEATDRIVLDLLDSYDVHTPPVDAIALAQDAFHVQIIESESPADRSEGHRFGPRPPRFRHRREVVLRDDMTDEARHAVCARACAREMIAPILAKLGVVVGADNRNATTQLVGLIAPRLLLPTRWFARDARKLGYDVLELKHRYSTVGYEWIALRLLDLEEPCIMSIIDDEIVSTRRANCCPANKKLTLAEQKCRDKIRIHGDPQKVRVEGWTTTGWPIPTGPFNRIILRTVPDEI